MGWKLLLLFPDLNLSSGYRCIKVNRLIGGADSSQHTKMEAGDLESAKQGNITIAKTALTMGLVFDQMIIEFGTLQKPSWIHLSYKKEGNRGQILRADASTGKTVYTILTKAEVLAI